LWAKPDDGGFGLINNEIKIDTQIVCQEPLIKLPATWYEIKDCPLCYDTTRKIQPLYETDKSSLTPAIIFDFPKGKIKTKNQNEIQGLDFDKVEFKQSLDYKDTYRNNDFRLYSIDTEKFIDENTVKIELWLKKTVKSMNNLQLSDADKIIIIAPCHESNSRFVNMVNDLVFNSSATIIYHQPEVDFAENFNLLYRNYLQDKNEDSVKIFYVDDSIISAKHFFEIYDLARNTLEKKRTPFTASIVLKDKTLPYVHNRVVLWSGTYFAFVNINQPPNRPLSDNQPLIYEKKRYELLAENFALHDVIIKAFDKKAKGLDSESENVAVSRNITEEKRARHELQFKVTHKIYRYSQRLHNNPLLTERVKRNIEQRVEIRNAILKVLCQYPFILFQPLKEEIFKWHKNLLEQFIIEPKFNYRNFQDFKFHIRRAVLLGNYQILEESFFEKALVLFHLINEAILSTEMNIGQKEDIEDFSVFLVRNYLELIQRNGWVAVKLKAVLKILRDRFASPANENVYAKQFYRMMQIEIATVVDDYVKKIEKEERFHWRDMYQFTLETKYNEIKTKNSNKIIAETSYVKDFFECEENNEKFIRYVNKFEIVESILGLDINWYKKNSSSNQEFINYLWIKQLLYADSIDKEPHLPKEIGYQDKIDAILKKMKGFFPVNADVHAFFIVTDRQDCPHSLYQDDYLLNGFGDNCSESDKFNSLSDFLQEQSCMPGNTKMTIAEYTRVGIGTWNDLYNSNIVTIHYLPAETKWLLLIRISQFEKDDIKTLGILGFYSKKDISNNVPENLLPKQLLMLLRHDMGEFIKKHHKNDEFAKLREEEIRNRYAYLAGHGRKMLQDLIEDSNCRGFFADIVGTINKLQYVFSTETSYEKRKNILKDGFPYEKGTEHISDIIEQMAVKIYETPIIENEVELRKALKIKDEEKSILDAFQFNHKLLKFIVFELLVNAKKNRYHFILDDNTNKNEIKISFLIENNKMKITIEGTGAKFDAIMQEKINTTSSHIKDKNKYEISSGIELMRNVIELIDSNNAVNVPDPELIEGTKYYNKVIVTLNEMLNC
jgi:hypothetical protein